MNIFSIIPRKIIGMLKKHDSSLEYTEELSNEKFPHYITMSFKWRPDVDLLMDINDWMKETYGEIGEKWGMYHYNRDKHHLYEFRFQSKDEAMRFKLVWG
jgi:hypothetical protein